jgi:hypothetical protein
MAVSIRGRQVSWGIPASAKTASDALVEGIVESVEITVGGSTAEIVDEDGDIVCRVDHGGKNTVTISTRVTDPTPALPIKGAEVVFSTAIDGVALNTGECYVDDAKIAYKGNDSSMVNITISHYPLMTTP